jgi:hypothetical protein
MTDKDTKPTSKASAKTVTDAADAFEEEQSHPADGGSWFSSEPEAQPQAKSKPTSDK